MPSNFKQVVMQRTFILSAMIHKNFYGILLFPLIPIFPFVERDHGYNDLKYNYYI